MIRIDGVEIKLEGSFSTLIEEAARAVHSIAKAASDEFEKDTEGEVSYDHVMEMILESVSQFKRLDQGGSLGLPPEIVEDFYAQLQKERARNTENPSQSFLDFDTSRITKNDGSRIIQETIKGVYTDERNGTLDVDDLKAINANKKKKRKK